MIADYKRIGSLPTVIPRIFSVLELIGNWIDRLDEEPEELQRGEVLSDIWAQGIIASILLGVQIKGFTWTLQENPYYKMGMRGFKILCEYKNTDGLQRITAIWKFINNEITVPGKTAADFTIPWNNRDYEIGGMTYKEINEKYDTLMNAKFNSQQLRVDIYGVEGHYCTPQQETYLFKYVANNPNEMNGQQWRNPTCSQIAKDVRNDARRNPVPLFKNDLFQFGNTKMDYDEVAAIICYFVVNGSTRTINKKSLNEFYEHPDMESSRNTHSVLFGKNINVRTTARIYYNFMYQILKDKEYKTLMKKTRVYSLLWFTHTYLKYGFQNKFNYAKIKEQFFRLHKILVKPLPTGEKSVYRSCLSSNNEKNITKAFKEWDNIFKEKNETIHIVYRDPKRVFSKEQIESALLEQGGVCAIDGKPLRFDEAIGGHDLAWSNGGLTILDNCIAIRKKYNDDMGTLSKDEYLKKLKKIA